MNAGPKGRWALRGLEWTWSARVSAHGAAGNPEAVDLASVVYFQRPRIDGGLSMRMDSSDIVALWRFCWAHRCGSTLVLPEYPRLSFVVIVSVLGLSLAVRWSIVMEI